MSTTRAVLKQGARGYGRMNVMNKQPIFVLLHEPLRGYYESEAERTFKRRSDPVPGGMLSIQLPHLDEMALGFKGC